VIGVVGCALAARRRFGRILGVGFGLGFVLGVAGRVVVVVPRAPVTTPASTAAAPAPPATGGRLFSGIGIVALGCLRGGLVDFFGGVLSVGGRSFRRSARGTATRWGLAGVGRLEEQRGGRQPHFACGWRVRS